MPDAFEMRLQLQKVVAYRELCRAVSRSGRENIFFALVMLAIIRFAAAGPQQWNLFTWIVVCVLVGSELMVGLFKWVWPSAEGFLLDSMVLLLFVTYNLGMSFLRFQLNLPLNPLSLLFSAYMLYGAYTRFKAYRQIRRLFADRPTSAHLAWFDELVREIRTSDPHNDELALDIPTVPHWKAKLLGNTAFFIALRGTAVLILGPDEFEITLCKRDEETGSQRALLYVHDLVYPEFDIGDVTWENYRKWHATNPSDDS